MTNYILRGELGFNTFYIRNNLPDLRIITREEELPVFTKDDHVVRWGTSRHVPNGPKILNKSKAMAETSNKGIFRKKVADAGWAPPTWLSVFDYLADYDPDHSVIIRPLVHQRSEQLFHCETTKQIGDACKSIGEGNYYISQYIKKEKEFRVFIAQGRPFIVVEKNPPDKNAVTWGCVEQGTFDYIAWEDWPVDVVKCAVESFNLSGLDFAAIDIIYKDGKAYFLEANTAPEILGYYGQCFAKVFSYMFEKGRDRIPVKDYTNWKNMIHPAMSNKAVV